VIDLSVLLIKAYEFFEKSEHAADVFFIHVSADSVGFARLQGSVRSRGRHLEIAFVAFAAGEVYLCLHAAKYVGLGLVDALRIGFYAMLSTLNWQKISNSRRIDSWAKDQSFIL